MADKPTQRTLSFDPPRESFLAAVAYEPTEEATAAYGLLEDWLLDPGTGKPLTELAGDALHALARALLDGKSGYFHHAEDRLEALKVRNGKTQGDDIPPGNAGEDFHRAVDDALDCLHERMFHRGR